MDILSWKNACAALNTCTTQWLIEWKKNSYCLISKISRLFISLLPCYLPPSITLHPLLHLPCGTPPFVQWGHPSVLPNPAKCSSFCLCLIRLWPPALTTHTHTYMYKDLQLFLYCMLRLRVIPQHAYTHSHSVTFTYTHIIPSTS